MDVVTDSPATWTQLITDTFISLAISDVDDAFRGSLSSCDLGACTRLSVVGTPRSRVLRNARGVRSDGSDDVLLLTPLDGTVVVRQEGGESAVGPGVASVHVANRPYELRFDQPVRVLVLQVPRRIVPCAELVSPERRRRAVEGAMVRVFRAFACETLAVAEGLSGSERAELGVTATELAVSVLGMDRPGSLTSSAGARSLRAAAQAFVRAHLADAELTPAAVARDRRVSLRSLQLAFADDGTSPAAFIRAERLRASRRMLGDPRHATRTVAQIGRAVGYADPSVFIRAFHRECGTTPAAWRTTAR